VKPTLVVAVLLAGAGLVVLAAEKPPDDYVTTMRTLAKFAQEMSKPEAAEDFALTKSYVPVVRDAFGVVERYWTDRNTDRQYFPEIDTSQDGIKLASDMGVAANLQSPEGIAAAVKDILRLCQPCHDKHREKGADGAFLIK
jgi:hypothetical protein